MKIHRSDTTTALALGVTLGLAAPRLARIANDVIASVAADIRDLRDPLNPLIAKRRPDGRIVIGDLAWEVWHRATGHHMAAVLRRDDERYDCAGSPTRLEADQAAQAQERLSAAIAASLSGQLARRDRWDFAVPNTRQPEGDSS